MSDFFLSFIRSSLDLFDLDIFLYVFFAFLGFSVILLFKFLIWGK